MKPEIMHLCEVGSSSRIKIGWGFGLTSLTLFVILKKRKYGIY
jgi:hypothetical protein